VPAQEVAQAHDKALQKSRAVARCVQKPSHLHPARIPSASHRTPPGLGAGRSRSWRRKACPAAGVGAQARRLTSTTFIMS
jgi:hypothetical protein